ncbi:MAG: hypothetical protein IID32_01765 [Planctomycetes bacterium]|nr:hypothetical protein [Planctomycetota bacterium]
MVELADRVSMGQSRDEKSGSGASDQESQQGSATAVLSHSGAGHEGGFSQEQYEVLLECSAKGNVHLWDQWMREHPNESICLKGADFSDA